MPAQVWNQRSEAGKLISLNDALLFALNCTFLCKPHHLVARHNQQLNSKLVSIVFGLCMVNCC